MSRSIMLLLAGIAIGILIAPDKGIDTRQKIADRLDDYEDDAKDFINDTSGKIKSKVQSLKGNVRDNAEKKI